MIPQLITVFGLDVVCVVLLSCLMMLVLYVDSCTFVSLCLLFALFFFFECDWAQQDKGIQLLPSTI